MTDDLLQLLSKPAANPEGSSVRELLAASHIAYSDRAARTLRERLRVLIERGQIELSKAQRTDIAGNPIMVPVYRVKQGVV